jgi:hypothetical protein
MTLRGYPICGAGSLPAVVNVEIKMPIYKGRNEFRHLEAAAIILVGIAPVYLC